MIIGSESNTHFLYNERTDSFHCGSIFSVIHIPPNYIFVTEL